MKQVLTVTKKISGVKLMGRDSLGRTYPINTDKQLPLGTTVLVSNGALIGTVKKQQPKVYEV